MIPKGLKEFVFAAKIHRIRVAAVTAIFIALLLQTRLSAGSYELLPDSVAAGFPFSLALKDSLFTCAAAFSHLSDTVSGNTINLGFTTQTDTAVNCPHADSLFGPAFVMPILAKGRYSVYAVQYPACYFSVPQCLIATLPILAGTLAVGDSATPDSWFLQPKRVAVQDTFTLQLLNDYYGNCPTWFSHTTLALQHDSLIASFVVETDTTRLCWVDAHPFGPAYAVPALSAGKYPVFSSQHVDCEYASPYCPVADRPPHFVDTLTVSNASALLGPHLRRSAAADPTNWQGTVRGYRVNGRKSPESTSLGN